MTNGGDGTDQCLPGVGFAEWDIVMIKGNSLEGVYL